MKIAVWKTGHEIADTIAEAVYEGLLKSSHEILLNNTQDWEKAGFSEIWTCNPDLNIGYGILRNMDQVFIESRAKSVPFIHLDRGYWKPGHYDGHYRISLNGTQQTTGLDKLEPDYERWDALGINIESRTTHNPDGRILICPPTDAVCQFFGIKDQPIQPHPKLIIRRKDSEESLHKDLDKCSSVMTFNSSVGWEALRQGIPVISDQDYSILGAYQKQVDPMTDMSVESRRRFFAVQAGLQLTLEEIRSGKIWPLLNRLLCG